ncbi:hypothetical protein WICMUC_004927 [Wickerhamomyces mucosus]|uniref:Arrestin C-terminal-like domain-containing protein n=1 Tax=Wickerhamomyces mucosus TaxID=1378264 RepID=A0A9P8PFH9_9ASCO|nr:hypothetical protein WICMUC_004927 [Wickerhamomyces mucosus]
MVLLGRSTSTLNNKQTSLFDIRIKGAEHDVLVIKGSPNDAPSVLLTGSIVLSVLEPMSIKKLNLKLYATLRLKWTNSFETSRGTTIKKPYRYEKKVFEHNWDNIEVQNYFSNLYDNYNHHNKIGGSSSPKSTSANSSSSSLKSLNKKSKSSTNLSSFGSTTSLSLSSQNHILLQGNYEFPFSAILPGSTLESVEGLPGASLVYKLQANIERGRFSNDLTVKKHLRIVRTLTPDAVELSETIAVDNTWPKKVEYTISIPARAVAIGSALPINMTLVPLVKGLQLGKIKISLVEYFSCCGSYGPPHSGERSIYEFTVSDSAKDINEDRWEVETLLNIPPSLSKCTQDVDVLTNLKVRHKLKFVVGLINPDGHVSELRASLPVILFISPFVALAVKNYNRLDSVADNSFNEIQSDNETADEDDDDVIFSADPELLSTSLPSSTNVLDIERQAPPNYGNHIYDRLWSEISIENTPDVSRSQTPSVGTPLFASGENLNDSRNLGKLTENLRRLHVQQRLQETPSLDSITISGVSNNQNHSSSQNDVEDDEDDNDGLSFQARIPRKQNQNSIQTPTNVLGPETDYFSIRPHGGPPSDGHIISPGISSPDHVSRVNSDASLKIGSPNTKAADWDAVSMSKVPSYQAAMKIGGSETEALSPLYDGGAQIQDEELSKPKSTHLKSSYLGNSRVQSTQYLAGLRNSSAQNSDTYKNSSNHSSPSISRTGSAIQLNALNSFGLSKSPNKNKSNGLTPLSQTSHNNKENTQSSSSTSSLQAPGSLHSRSHSFANLMGNLVHKKDQKK